MKAAEILRRLADMVDAAGSNAGDPTQKPSAQLEPVEVDNTDNTEASTMVPPLQQKLELLKKATGVENHFDGEEEEATTDELDLIKRNAGIKPVAVVMHASAEDSEAE